MVSEALMAQANVTMYRASIKWLAFARQRGELKRWSLGSPPAKRHRASSTNGETMFPFRALALYQADPY